MLRDNSRSGFLIGGGLYRNVTLRHHGSGGTNLILFVNPAVNDLHILQIFLNDLFAGQFDVLFALPSRPFADPINHMFFDQHANLFGQIGPSRKLLHPLTNDSAFG